MPDTCGRSSESSRAPDFRFVRDDVTDVKALDWRGPNSMAVGKVAGRSDAADICAFATLAKGPTDDTKVFLGA